MVLSYYLQRVTIARVPTLLNSQPETGSGKAIVLGYLENMDSSESIKERFLLYICSLRGSAELAAWA
jgi:hypothetical protein